MPLSEELKQLIAENRLRKTRPTGAKWTCGKRWDRIQTVRKNLERLHEENEVQYAVFLTYPNPRGNPSHYLYVEGEDMKNLVKNQKTFPKCFLELKPKWTNPATFVLSETLVTRKRLHSDENMERGTEESASAGPAEDNDLPAGPADGNDLPAGPAEENNPPAGPSGSYVPESGEVDQLTALGTSQLHHSNVDPLNLIQEDKALFQNQEKVRFQNATEPFTYIVNNKNYRVGPARKEPSQRVKAFKGLLTEPRPAAANMYSLMRDAIARLPNGNGSLRKITELLSESQYITRSKSFSKLLEVAVYCLPILTKENQPCVSFDKNTNLFSYLQHGFSLDDHRALNECFMESQNKKKQNMESKRNGKTNGTDPEDQRHSKKKKIHNATVSTSDNDAGHSSMTEQPIANASTVPFFTIAEAVNQSTSVRNKETEPPFTSHAPAEPSNRAEQEFDIANNSTAPFSPVAGASQQSNCDGNGEPVITPPAYRSPTGSEQETTVLTVEDFPDVEVSSRFFILSSTGKEEQEIELQGIPTAWTTDEALAFFSTRFCYEGMENN